MQAEATEKEKKNKQSFRKLQILLNTPTSASQNTGCRGDREKETKKF